MFFKLTLIWKFKDSLVCFYENGLALKLITTGILEIAYSWPIKL